MAVILSMRDRMGDEKYERMLECNRRYRKNNPDKNREYNRKKEAKIKTRLFELYGNKCNRCGFTDSRTFQLDHVNGGGNKIRKVDYRHQGVRLYRMVLSNKVNKKDYQLLCANCNWIKRFENNECRHYMSKKVS